MLRIRGMGALIAVHKVTRKLACCMNPHKAPSNHSLPAMKTAAAMFFFSLGGWVDVSSLHTRHAYQNLALGPPAAASWHGKERWKSQQGAAAAAAVVVCSLSTLSTLSNLNLRAPCSCPSCKACSRHGLEQPEIPQFTCGLWWSVFPAARSVCSASGCGRSCARSVLAAHQKCPPLMSFGLRGHWWYSVL